MKSSPGGLPWARSAGFVWLLALLATGCGTHTPGSATTSTSGATSAGANAVPAGAQLGLLWNPSDSTFRPLVGVPGAVRLGAPLFAAGAYRYAVFSPSSQIALLVDAKGNLQMMTSVTAQPTTVTQGMPTAAVANFAPRGAAAVVYAPGAASAFLISGLPQQPSVSTINAGAPIRGAAVSDQGTILLATAASPTSVSVTATSSTGTRSTLATLLGFGGAALLPGSEDVLLSDSRANTLVRIHSGSSTTLATHADGLNQPLAVAASSDARWAVTANHADGTLVRVDLTGATPSTRSSCACSPSQVAPLAGNAVFEIMAPGSTSGSAPGWMIEADDLTARVLFIPPATSSAGSGQ